MPGHQRRHLRDGRGEDGFVLLESIVSIALIGVLMAALTPFFASSISLMSRQRSTQVASQVATSAVEALRGLPASDLVTGHDATSVNAQFSAAPAAVQPSLDATLMTRAIDNTAAAGAGSSAALPTSAQTQTVNSVAYSVTTYLGRCNIPAGGSDADCATAATADAVTYLRAVIAVTWRQARCPASQCSYVTATLLSPTSDPTFNLQQTPAAVPIVVNPGNQTSTVGQAITPLQLAVQSGTGVPPLSWSVTGGTLPAGLALTTAGLISGVPTAVTATRSITVTVTDGFQRTASATFSWTVVAAPTVTSPGAQRSAVGATVRVALTTSCPATPCTYTLANAPGGLSVSSAGVISGTVAGPAGTYGSVSVTVTDANGATATTAPFTWTVYSPPTITPPSAQTTTTGATVSLTVGSTCPNAPCTYTLANAPAGLSISSTGVISGTVTSAAQTFSNVTVTVTDASGVSTTSPAFTWTVLARPTVVAPATQTTTTGATLSLSLTTTCANTPCTYTLTGGPAGLAVSAAGIISGTVTSAPQTFSNVSVTVTDAAGVSTTSSSFVWNVLARPSVTAPANQTTSTGGSVSLTLTKSCPNSPCSYTLNNGPAGLSVSAAGVISGTVTSSAQTFGNVSVTVTDAAGVSATSGTFTWTVLARPTIGSPGTLSTTVGASPSVALAYTCPYTSCTLSLANTVPGLGLNTAATRSTSNTTTTLTVTATSGTIYVNGVVQSSALPSGTSRTFAPTVTITDAAGSTTTSATGAWTVTGGTCLATTTAAGAFFALPLDDTSGTVADDVSGNNRDGTYRSGGTQLGQAGPCPRDTGRAVTLNGSTGYAGNGYTSGNTQVFSTQIWFKTTTTRGGKLIGYGDSTSLTGGASGNYDRHIYMQNDGRIVFGVYPGSTKTITSTNTYNDGVWHQVVGTLAPATDANPGLRLYVDGALVASDSSVVTAQVYSGYWHIGFDNLSGWPNAPTSSYFAGSLAWASIYTNALTPAQITGMWNAGN